MARDKGLACWTGKAFWDTLDPYRLPHNTYHFGEPGNFTNLTYLWDRFLLWVHLFCVTNCVTPHCLEQCDELEKYMAKTNRYDEISPES
eukprot:13035835-Heterocapsa_arctica.AAC.1